VTPPVSPVAASGAVHHERRHRNPAPTRLPTLLLNRSRHRSLGSLPQMDGASSTPDAYRTAGLPAADRADEVTRWSGVAPRPWWCRLAEAARHHPSPDGGWTNSHLHAFTIERRPLRHEAGRRLPRRGPRTCSREGHHRHRALATRDQIAYEYDFGDGWDHTVVVEERHTLRYDLKHAVCLDGANASPPEGLWRRWRLRRAAARLWPIQPRGPRRSPRMDRRPDRPDSVRPRRHERRAPTRALSHAN